MRCIRLNWLAALALLAGTEVPLALAAEPETAATSQARYIEGGIGVEERSALSEVRQLYNLQLIFASSYSGEYRADVDVEIVDMKGNVWLKASRTGPLLYAQLPRGRYRIAVDALGLHQVRPLVIRGQGRREMIFYWNEEDRYPGQ